MNNKQVQQLNNNARSKWQFMKNIDYNIDYTGSEGRDNAMLEAWHKGDEGEPKWKRSPNLPVNKSGLEIFSNKAAPNDLAADLGSHIDKNQQQYKENLYHSLTPAQVNELKRQSEDYEMSKKKFHMTDQQAIHNAVSALYRGGVYDQWSQRDMNVFNFSLGQKANLHKAGLYALTGQKPNGVGLMNLVKH